MKRLLFSTLTAITIITASVSASEQLAGGWTAASEAILSSEAQ